MSADTVEVTVQKLLSVIDDVSSSTRDYRRSERCALTGQVMWQTSAEMVKPSLVLHPEVSKSVLNIYSKLYYTARFNTCSSYKM